MRHVQNIQKNPSHAFMTENLRYQTFLTSDTCLMRDILIMTIIVIVTLDETLTNTGLRYFLSKRFTT